MFSFSTPDSAQSRTIDPEIQRAVSILKQGGLVALPTETVYGLGVDAENVQALERMYTVKGRPTHHPVIIHIANAQQLEAWATEIPPAAYRLAELFWPGPLTLILKRSTRVPYAVTGGQETVGIRVPNHPIAKAFLEAFGGGIAAPSANRFGKLSPTSAAHVQADLGNAVDMILDGGDCSVGVESTIVAFREGQPVVLRPGMITSEQIADVLARPERAPSPAFRPSPMPSTVSRTSGTLASHYAPNTPLQLVSNSEMEAVLTAVAEKKIKMGILAYQLDPSLWKGQTDWVWRTLDNEPKGYARFLYASLRELDTLKLDQIVVESVPETEDWAAVADRLTRAAHEASV